MNSASFFSAPSQGRILGQENELDFFLSLSLPPVAFSFAGTLNYIFPSFSVLQSRLLCHHFSTDSDHT